MTNNPFYFLLGLILVFVSIQLLDIELTLRNLSALLLLILGAFLALRG